MRFRQAMSVLALAMVEAEKLHPWMASGLCAVASEFYGRNSDLSLVGACSYHYAKGQDWHAYSSTFYWRKAVVDLCKFAGLTDAHFKQLEAQIGRVLKEDEAVSGHPRGYIIGTAEVGSPNPASQEFSHDALMLRVRWLRTLGRTKPARVQ